MAKFLNTSGTNYHLEELIKAARDRLVLIGPFLPVASGSFGALRPKEQAGRI